MEKIFQQISEPFDKETLDRTMLIFVPRYHFVYKERLFRLDPDDRLHCDAFLYCYNLARANGVERPRVVSLAGAMCRTDYKRHPKVLKNLGQLKMHRVFRKPECLLYLKLCGIIVSKNGRFYEFEETEAEEFGDAFGNAFQNSWRYFVPQIDPKAVRISYRIRERFRRIKSREGRWIQECK